MNREKINLTLLYVFKELLNIASEMGCKLSAKSMQNYMNFEQQLRKESLQTKQTNTRAIDSDTYSDDYFSTLAKDANDYSDSIFFKNIEENIDETHNLGKEIGKKYNPHYKE